MSYRSILIIFLATLGLAINGWGQNWDKIAFISDREGILNVWIMNADGSDPVNLTKGRYCTSPAWSPDGMKIAYIDFADDDIWLMDADGSNQQPVTDDSVPKTMLSWSADGSRIYYDMLPTGNPRDGVETSVIALDGSNPISVDWREAPHHRPKLSPDGTKEVFALRDDEDQIDIYIRDTSEFEQEFNPLTATPLTYRPDIDVNPTWSPDGMRIAFVSSPNRGDQFEIWVVDIDGSNLVELTNGLGGNWPTWRPAPPAATSVEAQSWGQLKSLLSEGTR
ncbi:MAG: hypothetical protein OXM01_02430 [Gemmatimonadota bacterium]|nr:hypothetical protein [Gemmatimonadota bacterium]